MTASVSPIDAARAKASGGHVDINHIKVVDRHRRDLGDLADLIESINKVGLLHPLVVDSELRLIAGQRRLEALRKIGWPSVPVRVVKKVADAQKMLEAERDENTCRKAMTPTELASLTDALLEIERPKAAERQAAAQAQPGERVGECPRATTYEEEKGKSTDKAAQAAGWSGNSYRRVKRVERAAADDSLPEQVRAVAAGLNDGLANGTVTPRAAEAALSDALTQAGVTQRVMSAPTAEKVAKAREMADRGATSRQIAEAIGIQPESMPDFRRRHDLEVPADEVVGKTRRIDSNRVVTEIVNALEAHVMGVDLVKFDDLDASQIEGWVDSLSTSLRSLNRFHKRLKEQTRD